LSPFTGNLVEGNRLTSTSMVVEPSSDAETSRSTSSVFESVGDATVPGKSTGETVTLPNGMLKVDSASPRTSSLVELYNSGETTPVYDTTPPLAIAKVEHTTPVDGVKDRVVEEKTATVAPNLSLPVLESSRPLSLGLHLN
jgi:hypothetical protein